MSLDITSSLLPKKTERAEHAYTQYLVRAAPGVQPGHLIDPDFWVHLAHKLALNDRLEVMAADGSFEAELRVVAIDPRRLWAKTRMIRYCGAEGVDWPSALPFTSEDIPADEQFPDGYKIKFRGRAKFAIEDRIGNIVEEQIPSKALALAKLAEIRRQKEAA